MMTRYLFLACSKQRGSFRYGVLRERELGPEAWDHSLEIRKGETKEPGGILIVRENLKAGKSGRESFDGSMFMIKNEQVINENLWHHKGSYMENHNTKCTL